MGNTAISDSKNDVRSHNIKSINFKGGSIWFAHDMDSLEDGHLIIYTVDGKSNYYYVSCFNVVNNGSRKEYVIDVNTNRLEHMGAINVYMHGDTLEKVYVCGKDVGKVTFVNYYWH